ncbi:MAG TPA: hypothetical protein VGL86_13320 [Polyangia bacterium]
MAKASTHRSVFYKVKGKVGYMSPEQARGEPVDARSDLFSLGVVLYEVLVGERLFVGDLMSSASQIYAQPIQAPSQKRPEIPADLDAVILKALSLDPAGRFQSAEEFSETLTRVGTRHRLIVGASEMSSHLKSIAGDDASMWLKMETLGHDRSESTQAHGTSVLSTQGIVDGDEERRPEFDVSDEDQEEDDEDSGVADLLRARNRPPSLPTGELTSVIAVREQGGAAPDSLFKVRHEARHEERHEEPHPQPTSSSGPRRITLPPKGEFDSEESRKKTVVRDSSSPSPRNRLGDARGSGQTQAPPLGDATKVHPPSQAGFARNEAPSAGAGAAGGSPLATAVAQASAAGPARRLPTSGVRPRPEGHTFEGTAYVRRPRRLIGIMIVLLLIGIGVALGVAFSGPELDVIDPTESQPAPPAAATPSGMSGASGAAATPPSGTGALRQPPPPAELPSPPSATPGTP